jgi:hypothetical protein
LLYWAADQIIDASTLAGEAKSGPESSRGDDHDATPRCRLSLDVAWVWKLVGGRAKKCITRPAPAMTAV